MWAWLHRIKESRKQVGEFLCHKHAELVCVFGLSKFHSCVFSLCPPSYEHHWLPFSCYMNSVMQVLFSLPEFKQRFVNVIQICCSYCIYCFKNGLKWIGKMLYDSFSLSDMVIDVPQYFLRLLLILQGISILRCKNESSLLVTRPYVYSFKRISQYMFYSGL